MSKDYNKETKPDKDAKPLVSWEDEVSTQILDEWEKGRSYVSDLDKLYEDIYRMIRGERPEKNYDWQSNLTINKVFQVVWTAIPYITQKIFGASPLMGLKSVDQDGAFDREQLLEFWHTLQPGNSSHHNSYFLVVTLWLLRALLNGVGIVKKTWHQKLKTESRTTETVIPMEIDEAGNEISVEPHKQTSKSSYPIEDWPLNEVVNNKDLVSDWLLSPGQSIRQGRMIIHRSVVDLNTLYDSPIKYFNLDDVDASLQPDAAEEGDHSNLKGMDGQASRPKSDIYADVEIYERQGIFPVRKRKEDGHWVLVNEKDEAYGSDKVIFQEMVATVVKGHGEDTNNILIRFEKNPYGEKTYIDMHIYLDSERWQSMGMVEPIKDLQTAINDNINAMFDEIWQNLMPPVVFNKFALIEWDTIQYAPGQRWMIGGNPKDNILFPTPSNITRDAWQKHALLDQELQQMSVTNSMQGLGKEKTATTNVMNAQLTAGKLDFIVKMVETTALIPSAQMDVRFAKKFAHPLTFEAILGKPFSLGGWEEIYKYTPAASSVKMEHQKEAEIAQDISLIPILSNIQNPNMPKIVNLFIRNILKLRGKYEEAELLDENYFETDSPAGNMEMLNRTLAPGTVSNEQGIPMSGEERSVRQKMFGGPKLISGGR